MGIIGAIGLFSKLTKLPKFSNLHKFPLPNFKIAYNEIIFAQKKIDTRLSVYLFP